MDENDIRAADWLGIYTTVEGDATWADIIVSAIGLDHHDDAQTLYLRILELQEKARTANP